MKRYFGKQNNRNIIKHACFVVSLFACSFSLPLLAFDNDDLLAIKPNLLWLSNDVSLPVFGESEYDSFISSNEIWYKKWGVSSQLVENNASDIFLRPADSEYFNVDLKRRFGNKDTVNFSLGLGWQEFAIDSQLDASGPRISLEGNYKLFKSFQLYGSSAYLPELNDSISDKNITAYEAEAGLLYSPKPYFSLKAGYRIFNLDLEQSNTDDLGSSSGFLFGSDLSW